MPGEARKMAFWRTWLMTSASWKSALTARIAASCVIICKVLYRYTARASSITAKAMVRNSSARLNSAVTAPIQAVCQPRN